MKLRPMLQVRDVVAASRWYQEALGLRSGHGGDEFEMLFDGDEFVLQLHRLEAHEHGMLQPEPDAQRGLGVSLWFESTDADSFERAVDRARRARAEIVEEPHWKPLAHHHEAMLRDPDGFVVVLHGPFQPNP